MATERRVAVVGGGITGLSAAHALLRRGVDVAVYERGSRLGGVIATERAGGWVADSGPNSVLATPAVWALVRELGLDDAVAPASPAARVRYLARGGRLARLPASPPALLATPLLSAAGKLRALAELLVPRRDAAGESVAAFVRRRLGAEVLDALVAPLVAGVHAGDPERLSAAHAFPALVAMEREHGSLLRGALRAARAAGRGADGARPRAITFRGGLAALTEALGDGLAGRVTCDTRVTALVPLVGGGWRVAASSSRGTWDDEVDGVVLAVPAHALGDIAMPAPVRRALAPVAAMEHAPVATLSLGFRRAEVAHPLDGFGVLAAPAEGTAVRGVLFASSVFAGRCPDGHVLLTCFVGGTPARADADLPLDALLARVRADLRALLGVRGAPTFVRHVPRPRAIPQYLVGHEAVEAAAARVEAREAPGVILAGSWRGGVSVGDCVAGGRAAAERCVRAIASTSAARGPRLDVACGVLP